eukprot:gene4479-6330_t
MSEKKKSSKHRRDEDDELDHDKRKAAKKAAKVAKMLGYSNDINPFGDSNLLQPFLWGKKKEKAVLAGKVQDIGESRLKTINEIEKVRKRRQDRENELMEMERLRTEEQRLRELAQLGDWQQKEEEFHLIQTKERSKLRLLDDRAKPIDLIVKNFLLVEAAKSSASQDSLRNSTSQDLLQLDIELNNPNDILKELDISEMQQLEIDIESYLQLEQQKSGPYIQFWESLLLVVRNNLNKSSSHSSQSSNLLVIDEIQKILNNKSLLELNNLLVDIDEKMIRGEVVDIEYWSTMRSEIVIQIAKSIVHNTHVELLEDQFEVLSKLKVSLPPPPIDKQRLGHGEDKSTRKQNVDFELENMELGDKEEKMGLTDEIALVNNNYGWSDKYRPRKPRYFNRVKTGWDWNKYNSTHYDTDNPPPRVIQGYRFTVFYPDLVEKLKAPKYHLEATETIDFVIIRFHAGPPYEDIAFKIINKEWDTHPRSGEKNSLIALYFNL